MEPNLPVPNPSPEIGTNHPQIVPPYPEALSGSRVESAPERPAPQELQPAGPVQGTPSLPVVATPPATIPVQVVPLLNPVPTTDTNPAVAGDDEVIEKAWVDKAKKIVTETKDNPYQQEKEVSKLQADYLKKRYGKEVKLASD